jgi:hypothetical protein
MYLGHAHIADLCIEVLVQEDIHRLEVPMQNLLGMDVCTGEREVWT